MFGVFVLALCWYSNGCKTVTFSGDGAGFGALSSPSASPFTCANAAAPLGPDETISIPYPDFPGSKVCFGGVFLL